MKRSHIVSVAVLGVVLLLLGLFVSRSGIIGQATEFIGVIKDMPALFESNQKELEKLRHELNISDGKVDDLKNLVLRLDTANIKILQRLDSIPEYEIPEISDVDPEDYEDCLELLSEAREQAGELIEIVRSNEKRIEFMEVIILNNEAIFSHMVEVIEIREKDVKETMAACEEMIRKSRQRERIAWGTTFVVVFTKIFL